MSTCVSLEPFFCVKYGIDARVQLEQSSNAVLWASIWNRFRYSAAIRLDGFGCCTPTRSFFVDQMYLLSGRKLMKHATCSPKKKGNGEVNLVLSLSFLSENTPLTWRWLGSSKPAKQRRRKQSRQMPGG